MDLSELAVLDYVVLAVFLYYVSSGATLGFLVSFYRLAVTVVGMALVVLYADHARDLLAGMLFIDEENRFALGALLLLLVVQFVGRLFGGLVLLSKAALGEKLNNVGHLLGGVIGLSRGALFWLAATVCAGHIDPDNFRDYWNASLYAPTIGKATQSLLADLPDDRGYGAVLHTMEFSPEKYLPHFPLVDDGWPVDVVEPETFDGEVTPPKDKMVEILEEFSSGSRPLVEGAN